jgi:hypothetical protein
MSASQRQGAVVDGLAAGERFRGRQCPFRCSRDEGGVTVEAAMALAVLAVVLVSCLAGIACLIAQIRCADAAREAARLAGRGDADLAAAAVATLAPDGAVLSLGGSGDLVTATVTASAIGGLLPGVSITASAAAARDPVQ